MLKMCECKNNIMKTRGPPLPSCALQKSSHRRTRIIHSCGCMHANPTVSMVCVFENLLFKKYETKVR